MKEDRPQRSPCSTDSRRKPGASPTSFRNAETGVSTSARTSRHTGTTVWSRANARKRCLSGRSMRSAGGDVDGKRAEEAAAFTGMTRAPAFLIDDDQHDVAVAVVIGLADPLT